MAGIEASMKGLCIELYAGIGGNSKLYKNAFNQVITNDINKDAATDFHMDAKKFVLTELQNYGKIDLIDFDCYGSPGLVIQEFFAQRGNKDCPLVVAISDGCGMWLKRRNDRPGVEKRYLIDKSFDMKGIWNRHIDMLDNLLFKMAEKYDMKCTRLLAIQCKGKNATVGSWLFIK
jgi:tRNA G26 N,N-dimethylase Trm1